MSLKKRKKMLICMLLAIYTYIILSTKIYGVESNEKDYLNVTVPSAIVIDAKTGRVLYSHNMDEERAMASLTKVMTSILLIENTEEDEIITAPKEVDWLGGSVMGLKSGDKLSSKDLLARNASSIWK